MNRFPAMLLDILLLCVILIVGYFTVVKFQDSKFYSTVVTKADLETMRESAIAGRGFWRTEKNFLARCRQEVCSISCSAIGSRAFNETDDPGKVSKCWLNFTMLHMKTYLALINEAQLTGEAKKQPESGMVCESTQCHMRFSK